ncbi:MAG: T9SS type A sorting domain-containing protein [Bacteroidales bacterium]|nr:T9SS type A sorting domain-containing protein [Bacteroidales bacterium]
MKKVFITLLTLISMSVAGAYAQILDHPKSGEVLTKTPTIDTSDILYWVGTGSNKAILIVSWDEASPAQSLAWGYRWNGSITAADMLTAIDNADTRLSINGVSSGFIDDISYSDATYNLSTELWWCYTVNDSYASGVSSQAISNGDVMEFSDGCAFTATTATPVPDPNGSTDGGNDDDNDTILLADATISADSIIYWVGQGSNEVVMAINWNNPDTALAWGFRFSHDSVTVKTIIDSIANADYRLDYTPNAYGIADITYTDSSTMLSLTEGSFWMYNINGLGAALGYDQQYVKNGDFVKWGDLACATIADSVVIDDPTYGSYTSYSYVWLTEINPVSIPEEQPNTYIPVITPEEIVYWVGEGNNQAILTANFVVNQADEEYIGLAWGYRWNSADTVTVAEMLAAIDNADDRFAIALNNGSINTMSYSDNNYTLSLTTEGYAMYSVNGIFPLDYCSDYVVNNNDVVTVGDYYCGGYTEDTYEGYWKELETIPVSNPNLNRFCGIVGTEGCTAIYYDDNRIKNWATTCTVERGYMDIATAESPVSFGTETNVIGSASESTTDAISLGDGGYAILTFERPITNGDGFDFAVYENSFNDYFLELAFVEVSSDGLNFVRFPATSLTPTDRQIAGDGTIDATNINNLAGKYRVGWGTPFDLDELRDSANIDINNITHVKIIDVVGTINPEYATYDAFGNIVNDPYPTNTYSGGFDLTGVCVLNEKTVSIEDNIADITIKLYPNPCHNYINIENANNKNISVYDVYGRMISEYTATSDNFVLNTQAWKGGVYVLKIGEQCYRIVKE